MKAVPRKSNF